MGSGLKSSRGYELNHPLMQCYRDKWNTKEGKEGHQPGADN
mgnify:CR=1 FL=1